MDYGGGYADNRQQTTEEAVPVNGQQTTVNRRPSGVMLLTVTTEEAMPENGKATPVNGQRSTVNGLAIRSDAVDDDNGKAALTTDNGQRRRLRLSTVNRQRTTVKLR